MALDASPAGASARGFASAIRLRSDLGLFSFEQNPKKSWYVPFLAIVCGVTIGQHAFIGAGAVITKDILPYALMTGVPARQIGWMSAHGERLQLPLTGSGEAVCGASGQAYRLDNGRLERQ
jgi:hypothetical protein